MAELYRVKGQSQLHWVNKLSQNVETCHICTVCVNKSVILTELHPDDDDVSRSEVTMGYSDAQGSRTQPESCKS